MRACILATLETEPRDYTVLLEEGYLLEKNFKVLVSPLNSQRKIIGGKPNFTLVSASSLPIVSPSYAQVVGLNAFIVSRNHYSRK